MKEAQKAVNKEAMVVVWANKLPSHHYPDDIDSINEI